MTEDIWISITNYLKENRVHNLLSMSTKTQSFIVLNISDDCITIQFDKTNRKLKLEKSRFISAYNKLSKSTGEWVKVGARRVDADPDSLEGKIKLDFNGNLNGISTAPWIATILVNVFDNIEYNGKKKGQAIRMKSNMKKQGDQMVDYLIHHKITALKRPGKIIEVDVAGSEFRILLTPLTEGAIPGTSVNHSLVTLLQKPWYSYPFMIPLPDYTGADYILEKLFDMDKLKLEEAKKLCYLLKKIKF